MTVWQVVGLLALSLWSAAGWLIDDLLPGEMTPVAAKGYRLLLLGGLSLLGLLLRPADLDRRYGAIAVASLGLVGLPYLLLAGSQGRVASADGVFVFALIPLAVAIFGGADVGESDGLSLALHGLLGVAGVLLLLPLRMPQGGSGLLGAAMLVAAMVLTAASLPWIGKLQHGLSLRATLVVVCWCNGMLLLLVSLLLGKPVWTAQAMAVEAVRCLATDLPETLLLLWLLKTISPWRFSARYVLAPLFTVLEGLWLVRPRWEIRTVLGVGLLLAGSALIVLARPEKEIAGLGLD